MERKDGNEVYEKPAVNIRFSYFLQISYVLVRIRVFELGEKVQNDINIEEDLNEQVPPFMDWICGCFESYVEEGGKATVSHEKEDANIEERLPF